MSRNLEPVTRTLRSSASLACAATLWLSACSRGTQEIGHARTLHAATSDAGTTGTSGRASDDATAGVEAGGAAAVVERGGGAGASSAPSCARATYAAQLKALDMFILLDQSGSMTEDDDRWTPVTKAIKSFVASDKAAGLGVALQYFPLGPDDEHKCAPETYATPAVAMDTLPSNAQPMADSIDAHYFTKANCCDAPEHDGTPTRPALAGVSQYMKAWLADHPDHAGLILLATDGEPSPVCDGNSVDEVSKVIEDAANGTPKIPSYVIGIGHTDKLNKLAAAGGTGASAFIVDGTGVNTESELLDALAQVRGQALPCDFPLPQGQGIDPLNVNVQHTAVSGLAATLVNVPSQDACERVGWDAWYYDDPTQPQRIVLCPGSCNHVASDRTGKVSILVGCATISVL